MKIPIFGEIVPDEYDWIYSAFKIPHFCPANLRNAISAAPEDREIELEINSPGGDVWSGFDAFSLLQGLGLSGYNVTATVTAMAASAASTIMSACRTVRLSPVAQVMIHDPATGTWGNIQAHKESVAFLQSIKESIINGYMLKSKGKTSRETFKNLMTRSTWMAAQQAVELGLADEIIGLDPAAGPVPSAVNSAGGSDLAELLGRYCDLVTNGMMEEDPEHPAAQVRAFLTNSGAGPAALAAENAAEGTAETAEDAADCAVNPAEAAAECTTDLAAGDDVCTTDFAEAADETQETNSWQEWAALRLELERCR